MKVIPSIYDIGCFLFAVAVFLVVLPLLLLGFLLVGVQYVRWYLAVLRDRWKGNSDSGPLDGGDALWVIPDKYSNSSIGSFMILDGTIDIDHIRQWVKQRVTDARAPDNSLTFPRMTQFTKVQCCRYVWVDDKFFSIDNHVRLGPSVDHDEIYRALSSIFSKPFPKDKPNWDITLMPLVNPVGPQFVLALRIHHSISDGLALLRMLLACTQKDLGISDSTEMFPKLPTRQKLSFGQKIIIHFLTLIYIPLLAIRYQLRREKNGIHGIPLTGQKLVGLCRQFPFSRVKAIKDATGTSVNDIVTSSISGALRRHLIRTGHPVPDTIHAVVPVSLHPHPDSRKLLTSRKQFRNYFSLASTPLRIGKANPMERLLATKLDMRAMLKSLDTFINFIIFRKFANIVPRFMQGLLFPSGAFSAVCSNVPGPQIPIRFCNYPVKDYTFWTPQRKDLGVSFSIFTYNGNVRVGLLMDSALVKSEIEVEIIVEDVLQEMEELERIACRPKPVTIDLPCLLCHI